MKKHTRILAFLAAVLLVVSSFLMTACNGDGDGDDSDGDKNSSVSSSSSSSSVSTQNGTEGLKYELNRKGDAYKLKGIEKTAQATDIVIPDTYEGLPVESMSAYAFKDNINIKSVTVGKNITKINISAFQNCTMLETVNIGDNVTAIGDDSFSGCTSLKNVNFSTSDKLQSIDSRAFLGCTALEQISIPDEVKTLGEKAFEGCSALTGVHLGDGITKIPSYAFNECTSLKTVNLDAVTEFGLYAFNNCKNLCKTTGVLTISSETQTISDFAFYGCSSIGILELPDKAITVGASAFELATSLREIRGQIKFSKSGTRVFAGCTSLKKVVLSCTVGGYSFSDCTNLQYVEIVDGVTSISYNVFDNCVNLNTIIVPTSIKTVGNAFNKCSNLVIYYKGTAEQFNTINDNWRNSSSLYFFGDALKTHKDWADSNQRWYPGWEEIWIGAPRYYYSETQPETNEIFWSDNNGCSYQTRVYGVTGNIAPAPNNTKWEDVKDWRLETGAFWHYDIATGKPTLW
ncbi:MAG: leucine-rich repeat domain-containing protein [Eubacteriales bacterium]|nr:leucine-rich repeat domain-containing protein [Eubacteriales bacterium]